MENKIFQKVLSNLMSLCNNLLNMDENTLIYNKKGDKIWESIILVILLLKI